MLLGAIHGLVSLVEYDVEIASVLGITGHA
jgi:hypothetical protein